jgi:hypothetical protein
MTKRISPKALTGASAVSGETDGFRSFYDTKFSRAQGILRENIGGKEEAMSPKAETATRNCDTDYMLHGIAERHETARPNSAALLELLIRELHLVPAEMHSSPKSA